VRSLIMPLLVVPIALAGCATKKYVSREVGEVNKKVEAVASDLEKTQERVQRSETRIDAVDKSAQSGIADAKGSAQQAMTKAQEAEKAAKGKLIYTVTLSNDKVTFPVNRAEISEEAKAIVDGAIAPFKAENRGVFFEIEGHTDAASVHGIALSRLSVISYGETKPVADNKTKEGRAQNRRVVIRVLE
jgi:peptidoglycan-associated lipoprotein